jgi:hypothetical protein
MAPRIRKIRHDEETRAKIQASQLVNRLTNHALGEVELSPTQVRAIEILLKKTLPDLSAVEHSGEMTLHHEDALDALDDEPGAADQEEAQG